MKLNTIKKLILEDFDDAQRQWLGKLLTPLNQFLDGVYTAVSGRLSLGDNLQAQLYNLTISPGQSTLSLSWDKGGSPTLVLLGKVTKTNGDLPADVIQLKWRFVDSQLAVTLVGLDANTSYNISIVGLV